MSTKIAIDDGIYVEIEGDGDRPRGCRWDETVCMESPEYRIVLRDDGHAGHVDAELYCPRHYALELARLIEVHVPGCDSAASAHLAGFGRIENTQNSEDGE